MQFVIDNYIWFIIGGVVILMAIIGYIADKTDFGRNKEPKPEKVKKEKKEKVKEVKPEKIEVDAKGITDLTESLKEVPGTMNEDLYEPLNTVEPVLNTVDASLYEPLPTMEQNQVDTVDPSLYAPLDQPVVEMPVEPAPIEVTSLPEEVASEPTTLEELPSVEPQTIETPVPETNDIPVADDEDVWKF